jgi:hypothetical protein
MAPGIRQLPRNPSDNEQIMDLFGNIFRYDTETDTWDARGVVRTFPIVTISNDGLVSSSIWEKLDLIQKLIAKGVKFNKFKIYTGQDPPPYYYYFYSTDDLVRFYVEKLYKNDLDLDADDEVGFRLEVDKARLYHKLLRTTCLGPVGATGPQGEPGRDGLPSHSEKFHTPAVKGDILSFKLPVNTPLLTDISVRLYRPDINDPAIEFIVPLAGTNSEIVILDEMVQVQSYDVTFEGGYVEGTVQMIDVMGQLDKWRYKARQKGPKGAPGNDGTNFVEIVTSFFDDSSLRATEVMISMRKSPVNDNIFIIKNKLPSDICVSSLRPTSSTLPIGSVEQATFAAVAVTTKSCKDIVAFQFERPEFVAPPLLLPSWEPVPCCLDKEHYERFSAEFDWVSQATNSVPFTILLDPTPPCQACQSDFFWCPNIGDNPCGVAGQLTPPDKLPGIPPGGGGGLGSSSSMSGSLPGSFSSLSGSSPTPSSPPSTPPPSSIPHSS